MSRVNIYILNLKAFQRMRENAHPLFFKSFRNTRGKLGIKPNKQIMQMRAKSKFIVYGSTTATLRKGLLHRRRIIFKETGEIYNVFFLGMFVEQP